MSGLFGDDDYPELLEQLGAEVEQTLVGKGIHAGLARECGRAAAERVRRNFGGMQIYLPVGQAWELTQRDRAIYDAWKPGVNEIELIREHKITERHLRRIIEARRAEDRAKRQGKLSLSEES